MTELLAKKSELGNQSDYDPHYNPDRLFPIARAPKREEINLSTDLVFYGFDYWNHYEVSWLNPKGKPIVATATIIYDCHSPMIIESKSMKLYFNSLNNSTFNSPQELETIIQKDIATRIQADVTVMIHPLGSGVSPDVAERLDGICLDDLDIECSVYQVDSSFLKTSTDRVTETLTSDLLKSNCLVTHQPDWGSVAIEYTGPQIDREGLLKYIVSFRNHNEFHEQCIERIYVDILNTCKPESLTVNGRYTRRGGLDINPVRSTDVIQPAILKRLIRQ